MNPVLSWLDDKLSILSLEIVENQWPKRYWPGLSDILVKMAVPNVGILVGRGIAFDGDLALTKASAEVIERYALSKSNLISSNGLAVGSDFQMAKANAISELVERDLLLCHFVSGLPLSKVFEEVVDLPAPLLDLLNKEGIALEIFEGKESNHGTLVVVRANGRNANRPFGFIFGFGLKEKLKLSIEAALFECLRDLMYVLSKTDLPVHSLFEFQKIQKPDFVDHMRLNLDIEYSVSNDKFFSNEQKINQDVVDYSDVEFLITDLKSGLADIGAKDISVVQASSASTNVLRAGYIFEGDIKIRSLQRFGQQADFANLLKPHFIS